MLSVAPLSTLRKGACVYIDSIQEHSAFGELDPVVTRRLSDLGFSKGMPLMVVGVGAFGKGPFAVRLGNQSHFALRASEASKIMCRVAAENAA